MTDVSATDGQRAIGRITDLERRLATLQVENRRLRNLLRVSDGVEPPTEQPTLAPSDPGLVTNASPLETKLALYEAQRARRSTWNIPRFIQGFDVSVTGDLLLPRGIRSQAEDLIIPADA